MHLQTEVHYFPLSIYVSAGIDFLPPSENEGQRVEGG
jgi:hypothetical protein